jgi:opacity protein-like surface antigen
MLARSAAALALLLLPALPARAEETAGADEDPWARPGLYGAAGGTFGFQLFEGSLGTAGVEGEANNSQGFELRFGYRAHPYVAAEFELDILDGFNGEVGPIDTAIDILSTTFSAKGFLPIGRFHPYLTLGGGVMGVDAGNEILVDDGTSAVLRVGGGMDVYVTDNFAVYLGYHYLLPFGDNHGLDVYAIHFGIQYVLRLQEP